LLNEYKGIINFIVTFKIGADLLKE